MDSVVFDDLRDLFAEVTGVSVANVRAESRIVDDLDIDSLLVLELGVAVNERWDIDLTDEDLVRLRTVADVVAEIDARTAR
jgi:acyl carrier protein